MGTAIMKRSPEQLDLPLPGVVTATSLELHDSLTFEQWIEAGQWLQRVEGSVMWWIGDWWRAGEQYKGRVEKIRELGLFAHQTYRDAGWVSEKFKEVSRRRDTLSWSHHKEVARLPPDKQNDWLDWAEENAASVQELRAEIRRERQLEKEEAAKIESDVAEWTITEDQSVVQCSALITDPPYGILDEEWEPGDLESFTREWAARWNECGSAVALIFWSQRYLWQGRQWFDEELRDYSFQQLLVWHYTNNRAPKSRMGFKQSYEPIFFYRRNGESREVLLGGQEWGGDLTDFDCHVSSVPRTVYSDENYRHHPSQKSVSVMRWLINAVSSSGDLICDPFAGSGTTGIAALQLGRKFHGIEISEEYREIAERRICAYGRATQV